MLAAVVETLMMGCLVMREADDDELQDMSRGKSRDYTAQPSTATSIRTYS